MVRRKQTKRLPGKGPPLGHLANQANEIEEELEPEGEQVIRRNSRKNNPESAMGPIRSGKGKKSNQPLPEDFITPTPRGKVHCDVGKRATKNAKYRRVSLPGVVIQDDVNRYNVDNVIQQVNEEIVEGMGNQEDNQGGEEEPVEVMDEEGKDKDGDNEDEEAEDDSDEEEFEKEEVKKKPRKAAKKPCAR
ncbi:mitotic apparatus protein p62-like [Papaver somniferum]|uniref:mitotic apparatus protein p62-like n=1 Tax=Papaver somniferum TaxID=3469 RepID=UPI000E6F4E07|nr:mitotic apparatus protein p62-like [Papaver somniferum]